MNSGYPLEWFAEPIDDYLKCGICNKVLQNPRATSCGHVFCQDCIQSWIEYYGICPNRCGELEVQEVTRAVHIEKRISGLLTRCKYTRVGCSAAVSLADKHRHERGCSYRSGKDYSPEVRRRHSIEESDPLRFFKSSTSTTNRVSALTGSSNKSAPALFTMEVQHTYRLKRSRTREPLGLVVVSGAKTGDGKLKNYIVKKVHPDTPASRAGLIAGDRVVQIDHHDLWRMSTQEAVARIKDRAIVTLTIQRGGDPDMNASNDLNQEHIYDEILYADLSQPQLSQDENFPPLFSFHSPTAQRKHSHEDMPSRHPRMVRPVSPSNNFIYRATSQATTQTHKTTRSGEKGSKDSGLSSGSSGSPHPLPKHQNRAMEHQKMATQAHCYGSSSNLDRNVGARHSYRTEREMLKSYLKSQKRGHQREPQPPSSGKPRNYRIEGDYEVEEIYLEKNGTSQLGLTLGYDTTSTIGHLYVCEVLPTGLAAEDGRLVTGDIIKRVNGFEVYDAEEAILLFLEQDQDITLTVARKIKTPQSLRTPSNQSYLSQPDHNFDAIESTILVTDRNLRRTDSCGSLDSHAHRYESKKDRPLRTSREDMLQIEDGEYEEMGSPKRGAKPKRNLSPLCNEVLSQQLPADHTFKPISGFDRPMTAGNPSHQQRQRAPKRPSSTTPDMNRRIHHHPVVARKFSNSSLDYEQRRIAPHAQSPPRRVSPQAFRSLTNEIGQLTNRCYNVSEYGSVVYSRTESLV